VAAEAPGRAEALRLVGEGRLAEAAALIDAEQRASGDGARWLSDLIVQAMTYSDLTLAGRLAAINAALERGSDWWPSWPVRNDRLDETRLSLPKLRHDLRQLRYLRANGRVEGAFDEAIAAYEAALERHADLGENARASFSEDGDGRLGRAYGRILHLSGAPRLDAALSDRWDRRAAEMRYRRCRPGIVVIDDFLTRPALESLLRFCRESTVWSGNRYAHGRLGALFFNGFNCPLLLQIAEEIREAFPGLIGERHPLRQLWGFKNTQDLPADSTVHADFAAINVNFWLTPESANLDPCSGGMVIYDLEAPLSWDFSRYNERTDLIRRFVASHNPRAFRVAYRQNRAIVFNSDLFHATEAVRFSPDYPDHRINVTMLYGDRRFDEHHAEPVGELAIAGDVTPPWRSAALGRARR
jgi:hypothetical protein